MALAIPPNSGVHWQYHSRCLLTRVIVFLPILIFLQACATTPGRDAPLGYIVSTAFSPDGKFIAASTNEGEVALFDAEPIWFRKQLTRASDKQLAPRGYLDLIDSIYQPLPLAFSMDGELLAAGGVVGNTVLWRLSSGEEIFRVPTKGKVHDIIFLPDGLRLVIVGHDVAIRSTRDGTLLGELSLPNEDKATSASVPPDGSLIVIGLSSGKISVYDAASLKLLKVFDAHSTPVSGLSFAPEGQILASTAGGYDLRLWIRNNIDGFENVSPETPTASATETISNYQIAGAFLWLLGAARGFQMVGAPTIGAPPSISGSSLLLEKAARSIPHHCSSKVAFSADGRFLVSTANFMLCPDCLGTLSPPFMMFMMDVGSKTTTSVRGDGCDFSISPDSHVVATGGPALPIFRDIKSGEKLSK